MNKLPFFDCNCSIGRICHPYILDLSDIGALKEEMQTAGIEEALVYHTTARDAHPPMGNTLLLEKIKNHIELYPVWVVLPHHTGEMPRPEKLVDEMISKGVKAVRMYPSPAIHSFSLDEWCSGNLLAALEDSRIPLVLELETQTWSSVQIVLKEHSQLPLIISGCNYRQNRFLYPLLECHKNLFIETSTFMGAGGIEHIVNRFGSRPLLFGTNMPRYTGTAAISRLAYANITLKDKEAIAGNNLRTLLKDIRT